jgi:hypothetical protein
MPIDPLKSGGLPQTGQSRPGGDDSAAARNGTAGTGSACTPAVAGDTVALSAAWRTLASSSQAVDRPGPILSSERMRQVLDRIVTDYYDRADVRDQIARSLARELASTKE